MLRRSVIALGVAALVATGVGIAAPQSHGSDQQQPMPGSTVGGTAGNSAPRTATYGRLGGQDSVLSGGDLGTLPGSGVTLPSGSGSGGTPPPSTPPTSPGNGLNPGTVISGLESHGSPFYKPPPGLIRFTFNTDGTYLIDGNRLPSKSGSWHDATAFNASDYEIRVVPTVNYKTTIGPPASYPSCTAPPTASTNPSADTGWKGFPSSGTIGASSGSGMTAAEGCDVAEIDATFSIQVRKKGTTAVATYSISGHAYGDL